MATIVHFDIPVEDIDRAKKFYEKLFDWKIEKAPGEIPYYFIETSDINGEKGIGGGMEKRETPGQQISNFIRVLSVEKYANKVVELGGKIIQPKTKVVGWGFFVICCDTENNKFGLWEDYRN
jgi:predicted enzyme related to lactoylglutathione lyase